MGGRSHNPRHSYESPVALSQTPDLDDLKPNDTRATLELDNDGHLPLDLRSHVRRHTFSTSVTVVDFFFVRIDIYVAVTSVHVCFRYMWILAVTITRGERFTRQCHLSGGLLSARLKPGFDLSQSGTSHILWCSSAILSGRSILSGTSDQAGVAIVELDKSAY